MASTENNIIVKYKYPNFDDKKLQKKIALKKEFKYPYLIQRKVLFHLIKKIHYVNKKNLHFLHIKSLSKTLFIRIPHTMDSCCITVWKPAKLVPQLA